MLEDCVEIVVSIATLVMTKPPFLGQLYHWLSATLVATKRSPQKSASASKKRNFNYLTLVDPEPTSNVVKTWFISSSVQFSRSSRLVIAHIFGFDKSDQLDHRSIVRSVRGRILDANHLPFYLKFHLSKHHPHSPPASSQPLNDNREVVFRFLCPFTFQ